MNQQLEVDIVRLLSERRLTIATGESCTGGLIANRITNVPGSSNCLLGSLVAYSNEIKEKLGGVSHQTLLTHGAVSAEVASELARGVRKLFNVDIGISVTGIAGPGGATPEKPVGLTYIGIAADGYDKVTKHVWQSDRIGNKEQSSEAALDMALEYLGAKMVRESGDERVADVEATLNAAGHIAVTAFTWQGQRRFVVSSGRQWQEADQRRVLVQTASGETIELSVTMPAMRWSAKLVAQRSHVA